MPPLNRPLRLLLLAALALLAAALLWLVLGVLHSAITLWQDLRALPGWAQMLVAGLLVAALCGLAWIGMWLLGPRRRKPVAVAAPTRGEVEQRIDALKQRSAETSALEAELAELDRRARAEQLYVAVFGEISAGKSSVIRALAPDAEPQVDVLGGTTRAISHYAANLPGGQELVLADVPGTHEVSGSLREQLARDEALRAHVVLYVCAGDLTRDQDAELRWLRGFGKPLVLALNKADQFAEGERAALERALRERYAEITDARVVVSAGGVEDFERRLADGRVERVRRDRKPDIGALSTLLQRYAAAGPQAFETARESAVLSAVDARAESLSAQTRERDADAIVAKYTRRAVVGAMAAVMPGSDLVIQGVLATGLIRELGKLYGVSVRDIDIDAFLGQVKLTLRTSASLVLAIAGNAAKAFPGLGTLGGGVLHAIAYGLIFDSLGHAVATTMREHHCLDAAAASASLATLLADTSAGRLKRIAEYALQRADDGA
ncbi:MAG TPA: Era-like GTP-binding protein [Rudaea sp.]|nr:Era-like GTP-binding protein [Rudaea sp.]